MRKTAQELIAVLQQIEANPDIVNVVPTTGSYTEDQLHPLVREALNIADTALITNGGDCDWAAHTELKAAGFPVRKGEGDSFGWLSGMINTSKGDICYG